MLCVTAHHFPALRVLSPEQVEALHLASLEILARTGVLVQHPRALELLQRAGARVEGQRVRLPAHLVKAALATAPERVVIAKRTGERSMALEAGRVFFGTGSDTPTTIDLKTRERRPARFDDVVDLAHLCDALPNIDFVMSMGIPSDVPREASFVHEFAAMLRGTVKPIVYTAQDGADMAAIHAIAVAVAGGEEAFRANPFLVHYAEPISPLVHSPIGLERLLFCADHGVPVAYVSGMGAGGTAPITLAGACAQASAECLSGLVIHQLAVPGAPFIYGTNIAPFDMRELLLPYGAPEFALANAVFADLARFYRLPAWGAAGASDAKTVDAQAGAEAMCSVLMAVFARGNLIHDVGYLESGLTSSAEMITLCDEIIGMAGYLANGVTVDAEHLALDTIDEVGPGGHFLDRDHTVRHLRRAHFLPHLADRRRFDKWLAAGSPDAAGHANARAQELLAGHEPAPLPDAAEAAIREVLGQC